MTTLGTNRSDEKVREPGKRGGSGPGAGRKKKPKAKLRKSTAQQVLDDIGEKKAWLEQWKASAGDLTARRNLFNDLLNRVYGRAAASSNWI
jgi:hypothetical protein